MRISFCWHLPGGPSTPVTVASTDFLTAPALYPEIRHLGLWYLENVLVLFHSAGMVETLSSYPYITVRIGCEVCARKGSYRLARLAAKYGAECPLEDVLEHLAGDCGLRSPRHPYNGKCKARFVDLPPNRPPDAPMPKLRLVAGGRS